MNEENCASLALDGVGIAGSVGIRYTTAGLEATLANTQLAYLCHRPLAANKCVQIKFRNPGESMKKLFGFAALFLLFLAGCSLNTGPDPVRVDVTTSLAKMKAGDANEITVTVTNESDENVNLPVSSCVNHFAVRDATGAIVGPAGEACTAQLIVKTLAPGEKAKYVSTWHGEAFSTVGAQITYLKPGTYTIEGFFGINSDSHPATVEITQ